MPTLPTITFFGDRQYYVVMERLDDTLIIINREAGGGCRVDADAALRTFGGKVRFVGDGVASGTFTRVVAFGGDGTLNHLINDFSARELIYVPCGTFNECAKGATDRELTSAGEVDGKRFAYVLATGAFTPLGYSVSPEKKRKLKIAAYLFRVIAEYKIVKLPAKVDTGDVSLDGEFSLIMLSNSCRCFGFKFNRLHKKDTGKLQLLTIKSPHFNGILGYIEMFFPFFRAFFIGFSRPHIGQRIYFNSVERLELSVPHHTPFCVDGDLWLLSDTIKASSVYLIPPVKIIPKSKIEAKH